MAPTTPPTSTMGMINNMIGILPGAHVEPGEDRVRWGGADATLDFF